MLQVCSANSLAHHRCHLSLSPLRHTTRVKIWILVFAILLVFMDVPAGWGQETEQTETPSEPSKSETENGKRIQRLLNQLHSDQESTRVNAQDALLKLGQDVIPYLKRRIRNTRAAEYYELLRQIQTLHNHSGKQKTTSPFDPEERLSFSIDQELKRVDDSKDGSKTNKSVFLKQRYRDALDLYKKQQYKKARRLARSLLVVAPDVSFRDRMKEFLVRVREKIVNSSIVRGGLSTDKYRYQWGEVVHLQLSLRNVSDKPLALYFDTPPKDVILEESDRSRVKNGSGNVKKGADGGNETNEVSGSKRKRETGEPNQSVLVSDQESSKKIYVEIVNERIGIYGSSVTQNRHRELKIPSRIRLRPGAIWTKHVAIKTTDFPRKSVLRKFRIRARVRPALLVAGEEKMSRWITFREVQFEVFPEGMRQALPATPEKIKDHLRSGNVHDVFFLTRLLPAKHHEQIVKYFLTVLPYLKKGPSRTIMVLLRFLTEQDKMYKKKKWVEWGRSEYDIQSKEPRRKNGSSIERHFDQ